jgi:hypothetical protein
LRLLYRARPLARPFADRDAMSRVDKSSTRADKMIKQPHYLNSVSKRKAHNIFPSETLYLHATWSKTLITKSETRFMVHSHRLSAVSPVFTFLLKQKLLVIALLTQTMTNTCTGCFKTSFTTLKAYINLFRGHVQYFELS